MASLDELISQVPIDQVAQKLGVDTATAETAVRAALPTSSAAWTRTLRTRRELPP